MAMRKAAAEGPSEAFDGDEDEDFSSMLRKMHEASKRERLGRPMGSTNHRGKFDPAIGNYRK